MTQKKLYRTVIQVEILSDEPYNGDDLDTIQYDITDGHCSGILSDVVRNEEVIGADAVNRVKEHGTDTTFFNMDEEGNEFDEDDWIGLYDDYSEVRDDYEEDGFIFIDAWKTDDDGEGGCTVAKVNGETGEVVWLEESAKKSKIVQEVIQECIDRIKKS